MSLRSLAALALLTLSSAPLAAQVHVRGLANVGYDAGYAAPSVGLGAEMEWAPADAPLALALRPSADLVLARSLSFATPLAPDPYGPDQTDSDVTRFGAEVVVRWTTAPGPAVPYLKAGLAHEYERIRSGDLVLGYGRTDAVAGAGASFGRVYADGTLGFGDASRSRVALGVRF